MLTAGTFSSCGAAPTTLAPNQLPATRLACHAVLSYTRRYVRGGAPGMGAPRGRSRDQQSVDNSISVLGSLDAVGTGAAPVVFTSLNDNSVGAAFGSGNPKPGDWQGIRFASATTINDNIDHVLFAYAADALSIGNLNILTVTNSQFSYNVAAFTVDATTANDPVLAVVGAAVGDCIPPYTSEVDATTDYFGKTGFPGSSLDLSSFIGETLPDNATVQGSYAAVSNYYSPEASIGDNTIPYSMFDCLGVSFPVTPILTGGGIVMFPGPVVAPVEPFTPDFEAIHKEQ